MPDDMKGSRSNSNDVAPASSAKRWRRVYNWLLRFGNSRWVVLTVFVFYILIPNLYVWTASIPDNDHLRTDSGVLSSRRTSGYGYLTELEKHSGTIVLTCRNSINGNHDCYFNSQLRNPLVGKSVTVTWFEQPIYLFSTQNRLVELRVGNKVALSRAKTEANLGSASLWGVFETILIALICIAADRFLPSRQKEKK